MPFRRFGTGLAAAMVIAATPATAVAQQPEPPAPEPQWQEGPPDPDPAPAPQPAPAPAPAPVAPAPAPPAAQPPYYPPYWQQPREDPMRTDPLLPVGITFLSIGAVVGIAGALVYVAADDPELVCSGVVAGCVERPQHSAQIASGGVIGAGIGMAAVSVPAIIQGVGKKPREGYRRSHGMTAAGSVFANLGAGVFGIGAGSMIADTTYGNLDARTAEIALMGVGGALVALGGVLWGLGAERIDSETPKASTAREEGR